MCTDCVCSGAHRAPCRLAACAAWILWREASRFVIARRPKADVAISRNSLRIRRGFPMIQPSTARFPRRFAPRNDTSGWCGGAPVPSCSGIAPYRALTARKGHAASVRRQSRQRLRSERRYTPYFGVCRFNGSLCRSFVPCQRDMAFLCFIKISKVITDKNLNFGCFFTYTLIK